jgi:nitroreductase
MAFKREKISYSARPLPRAMDVAAGDMQELAEGFRDRMANRHSIRDYSSEAIPKEVIEAIIRTAGNAPSGANHQPWHFVAIRDPEVKAQIRAAAEEEERAFYAGGGGDEWIKALEPIGTGWEKPHLTTAPWLIVIFAQRYGEFEDGTRYKNYYVPESVGIATGFLIAALHHAGLYCLTHTPNPMKFLGPVLGRPKSEKPTMILVVGKAAGDATVPEVAMMKKPLSEILTII